jgi:hypothetical protein
MPSKKPTVNWYGPNEVCVIVEIVMGKLTAAVPEIVTDAGLEHDGAVPEAIMPQLRSTVLVKPG